MVVQHAGERIAQEGNAFENLVAGLGVTLDGGELLGGEAAHLGQDALGNADLAHIVHQTGDADALGVLSAHAHLSGEELGEEGDALAVAAGVGVFGVDGGGEGVECPQAHGPLLGEPRDVLVEGAQEVGDGVDELHLRAGDVGIGSGLVAGDNHPDDRAVVGDGVADDLGAHESGEFVVGRGHDARPAVLIGLRGHGAEDPVEVGHWNPRIPLEDEVAAQVGHNAIILAEGDGDPAEWEGLLDVTADHVDLLCGRGGGSQQAHHPEEGVGFLVGLDEFAAELAQKAGGAFTFAQVVAHRGKQCPQIIVAGAVIGGTEGEDDTCSRPVQRQEGAYTLEHERPHVTAGPRAPRYFARRGGDGGVVGAWCGVGGRRGNDSPELITVPRGKAELGAASPEDFGDALGSLVLGVHAASRRVRGPSAPLPASMYSSSSAVSSRALKGLNIRCWMLVSRSSVGVRR